MKITLKHTTGSKKGQTETMVVQAENAPVMGRQPGCDVLFDAQVDLQVSARHASLTWVDDAVMVEDLGSSNGTYINGKKVEAPTAIRSGEVLKLGESGPEMTVTIPPSGTDQSVASETEVSTKQGVGANTVAIMINEANKNTSRKFTTIIALLAVIVIACIGVIIFLFLQSKESTQKQAEEIRETSEKLEAAEEQLDETKKSFDEQLRLERGRNEAASILSRAKERERVESQIEEARVEVSDEMRTEFEDRQKDLVKSITEVETTLNDRFVETAGWSAG